MHTKKEYLNVSEKPHNIFISYNIIYPFVHRVTLGKNPSFFTSYAGP